MKKLIAVLLITLLVGGGSLWAADTGMIQTGAAGLALGAMCVAIPMFVFEEGDNTWWYIGGGALAALSLGVMIAGAVKQDPSYAKAVENNPVLKHVSLAGNGKQTYVGLRFSF